MYVAGCTYPACERACACLRHTPSTEFQLYTTRGELATRTRTAAPDRGARHLSSRSPPVRVCVHLHTYGPRALETAACGFLLAEKVPGERGGAARVVLIAPGRARVSITCRRRLQAVARPTSSDGSPCARWGAQSCKVWGHGLRERVGGPNGNGSWPCSRVSSRVREFAIQKVGGKGKARREERRCAVLLRPVEYP